MRISDLIAHYIEQELERRNGSVQLSRGELAEHFKCVPSQINYVLTTRFTPEHGYTVDSRRGGGGYAAYMAVLDLEPASEDAADGLTDTYIKCEAGERTPQSRTGSRRKGKSGRTGGSGTQTRRSGYRGAAGT